MAGFNTIPSIFGTADLFVYRLNQKLQAIIITMESTTIIGNVFFINVLNARCIYHDLHCRACQSQYYKKREQRPDNFHFGIEMNLCPDCCI